MTACSAGEIKEQQYGQVRCCLSFESFGRLPVKFIAVIHVCEDSWYAGSDNCQNSLSPAEIRLAPNTGLCQQITRRKRGNSKRAVYWLFSDFDSLFPAILYSVPGFCVAVGIAGTCGAYLPQCVRNAVKTTSLPMTA